MLAIKECLIREGVLNLTSSTSNHHDTNNTATNGFTVATSIVGGGGGGNTLNIGTVGVSVADTNTSAGANNINNIYRYNNNYNDGSAASINNLRAINANYSYNNSNKIGNVNRNNHNYDMASVLALADTLQLAANLSDEKKSVDTTHFVNTNNTTNNENQSSNCSLSSISATAKSNCQPTSKNYDKTKQLQQTQELQRKRIQEKKELQQLHTKSKQQPTVGTNKPTTRYHGVYPHFHHHTAPAYYTDVNLHIHTPKANDVAALNENYQSVYNTPSQLINEHYFPKTSTATVVPPPIGTGTAIIGRANTTSPTSGGDKRDRERERHYYQTTKQQQKIAAPATTKHSLTKATARAAFFRGGSVGNKERKRCEPFVQTTSPAAFGRAAKKGDFLNLNDTKTSYDDITSSHDANTSCDNITDDSSFVACDINETSSECSKIKHLVNKIDTSYINNTNKNNHIPITSPTSTGNTSAGGAASPTGVGNTSTSTGRSHHSNRFAGKKRAVRVRSESRPISALYDIICKEKGLDIGTSATSDENSLSAASNDIENYSGGANTNANQNDGKRNNKQKRRNRSSKERSRSQRSNSRHDSLNTHNDYSEISNCLNAFVANSIATYLGEEGAAGDLAEAILLNTSINPYDMDKNASDRTKRAHKTRTASSQKSVSSKKRKDHGKTSKMQTQTRNSNNTERYAASDDELNGATAESSGDAGARTKSSSARTKYRTIASDGRRHAVKTNGLDKASSLPPRLYGGAHITSPSFCDQEQKHTASCYLNVNGADAYTYAMHKKCPVHCGCQLEKSSSNSIGDRCSSLKHDQNEYHHQAQSLSLPPLPSSPPLNLSLNAGPPSSASCMRSSPITAEDNSSIVAAVDSRISPVKFYVEPINMTLSGMSSGTSPSASAAGTAISAKGSVLNNKNANSSSSGVVVTEPTSNSNSSRCNHQRISRAQQRRFREELGRFTDLPQLDLLSPRESEVERAVLSEDEGVVAVVKEGKGRSSKTRRFINRPSRTPSRGRTGNSVNGSPHPSRRGSTHQHNYRSESSESSSTPSSSPPASNGCCASTTNNNRRISSAPTTTSPPPQPVSAFDIGGYSVPVSNISLAGITIEDVGSASSSADHISTLIKLSPLDIMTNSATPATELRPPAHGGVAGAETELNCAASGASNGEVQVAIADKKKCEEDAALYQRSRSPTSPRPPTLSPKYQSPRPSTSSSSDNARDSKLSAISASLPKQPQPAANGGHKSTTSSVDSPKASKKPIPSISVSVKQNLSEMHYNGDIKSPSSPRKVILVKPKKQRDPLSLDTECTAKFTHSAGRLSTSDISDANLVYSKNGKPLPCPRTTITVKTNKTTTSNEVKSSGGDETSSTQQERSSVNGATPDSSMEERDKSSKRKSNLNRSFNDEATVDSDDSLAARRRRRRELGMVRQLVPSDDAVVREMLLAHQNKPADTNKSTADAKSAQNDLAYHMEIARRGWDLFTTSAIRARSETGSPKYEVCTKEVTKAKSSHARLPRRSDTLHLGELRKLRSNDVNRKVNERTKSDLAEIKKIAEQANVETAMMASGIATELAEQAVQLVDLMSEANGLDPNECFVELPTPPRYGLGCRDKLPPPAPSYAELEVAAEAKERDSLPAKHATFVQEEPIYYDPEKSDQLAKSVSNTSMASGLLRQRMLKARSMERDAGHEPPKLSPILRRRSTDDPAYITIPTTSSSSLHSTSPLATSHNHIVSILKKKDHIAGESSSASSNASPVTFSANVVDTPTTKYKRAGILKKRSSLDESRYYSRSHSPDERSILIKSARRNSLEEIAGLQQQQQQHGILKQSSYESSKSDGCPSATEPHPHGILKKKDSTSTPSDGGTHAPKHVSISQAVKMAAAELGHEAADSQYATAADHDESGYTPNNEEYEIRPILKLESTSSDDAMRPPKPILKKKSSGDSDEYEIRPILKTSRKSSREEFDLGGSLSEDGRHHSEQTQLIPPVRPILKTDSPSKRRSLGGAGTDWLDDQDVFNDAENARESALSLKRRTRSLDRQETPVVDLAEALNAIATSQAAPVEFVSTPITTGGSISVAERIRNMEKFLNSAGNSPTSVADGNSSWDSPLQSGVSPRLLKPSAIKRDMYRDRYKTQPVTNDEKMLFKVNASPLDTSSTSAFKPAKSLDAGLNYTTFAHLNAPSAASSHTPGSTYTLTRCATQPVHPQQYQCNQFNAGIGAETVATSTPPLRQLNSVSDTTTTPTTNSYNNSNSISEQLTLSLGSDSERIFEMSGINDSSLLATSEGVQSQPEGSGSVVGSGGLSRQNSVRARANMFQKIHEKKKSVEGAASTAAGLSREGQTSPRRALPQFSPTSAMLSTPPIMSSSLNSNDEPNTTPQNPPRTDEEIEPTSLPVSERLRFFTNLAQAAKRCASSSYARSPPQRYLSTDRCSSVNSYNYSNNNSFTFSPRSSYNGGSSTGTSSASVTPTPMDCCQSPPLLCQPQLISINEIDSALKMKARTTNNSDGTQSARSAAPTITLSNGTHETSAFIKLTKSSSQTSLPSVVAQRLLMTTATAPARNTTEAHAITSASELTPITRRIKMKYVGKLLLPHTFLNNERNHSSNNNSNGGNSNTSGSSNDSGVMNGYSDAFDNGESNNNDGVSKPPLVKKIGKIKSPFIENCLQMQQKNHQLNSKCMKYDHKSTPHNALAALENNVTNAAGGERDISLLAARKPLQNGNAAPATPLITHVADSENDIRQADAGKENNYCETNGVPLLTLSPTASSIAVIQQTNSPVVEMRKKFTRIMSSSTLSTMAQRHTAYGLSNGGLNVHGNGSLSSGNSSSAPTTPRNSIIDEKFAKYFGLKPSTSTCCTPTITTIPANKATIDSVQKVNDEHARLLGAGETRNLTHNANKSPPLPPPDFVHTINGSAGASMTMEYANNNQEESYSTPLEAINHNVRSNSNTPYYTPLANGFFDITTTVAAPGSALDTLSNSVQTVTNGVVNALQRRRDMAKRPRANTTNNTFTPTTLSVQAAAESPTPYGTPTPTTPGSGRTRALRARALTLTNGVLLPEVKRYEDIVVTIEEFQSASKEFERIFLDVI